MHISKLPLSRVLSGIVGGLMIAAILAGCQGSPGPAAPTGPAAAPKTAIRFADGGWESIQVHNRIAAFIIEKGMGYPASEFIPGETIPLFAGLSKGDIDINMEVWTDNQQEAYDKAVAAGQIVDLGGNFLDNWQGWLVPAYMVKGDPARGIKATAPDLTSIEQLPKYWELFKDPEDPTKGRFYGAIAGWEAEKIDFAKFKVYGLDRYYNIFLPGSGAALAASMVGAYQKGEPWFGYYWAPTWILGKLDMIQLEEPPYDKAVWDATRGCSYPAVAVNIVVHSSFPAKAPDVAEFLRKYETTTPQNNAVLAYMQENKASTEGAAVWFLKNYESVWTAWVSADVASKVKTALP